MEDLKKQYGDMKEIDLQDKGLRSFDRIAREYKVQYAVYKTAKGQYQIFFKAPSEASMNAAFQKYSKNRLKKEQRRESVLGKPMSIPQKDVLPNKSIHSLDQVIQIPPIIKVIRRNGVHRLFSGWSPTPYRAGYKGSGTQSRQQAGQQIQASHRRE